MKAFAVIGANYGDEGKGVFTDYLVAKHPNSIVVRFNGGAQAAHTVVTPDGQHRHAFGHFGSGSFLHAPTYLSRFFVVNPLLFLKEHKALTELGLNPRVYVDGQCPVTTPWDMAINQTLEKHRGDARHGSCGVGFGETLERDKYPEFRLRAEDLWCDDIYQKQMAHIGKFWVDMRCKELGIKLDTWTLHDTNKIYFSAIGRFRSLIFHGNLSQIKSFESVIFEGAQGLLLDQGNKEGFPHVTRSNTGIANVNTLSVELGLRRVEATYASRCYLTRHGAGGFQEDPDIGEFFDIKDATNIENQWQGGLRLGYLDIGELYRRVYRDAYHGSMFGIGVSVNLFFSCCDQVRGELLKFRNEGRLCTESLSTFCRPLPYYINAAYFGRGPTRDDVKL